MRYVVIRIDYPYPDRCRRVTQMGVFRSRTLARLFAWWHDGGYRYPLCIVEEIETIPFPAARVIR